MDKFLRRVIGGMLIVLVLFQPESAVAWGNEGHTYVNRVAAEKIPASMPRFLRRAVVEIAYLGPEPDRWRSPTEVMKDPPLGSSAMPSSSVGPKVICSGAPFGKRS